MKRIVLLFLMLMPLLLLGQEGMPLYKLDKGRIDVNDDFVEDYIFETILREHTVTYTDKIETSWGKEYEVSVGTIKYCEGIEAGFSFISILRGGRIVTFRTA